MEHPGPASVNQLSSSSLNATISRCGDTRISTTIDTHGLIVTCSTVTVTYPS